MCHSQLTFFHDIVELDAMDADGISQALLQCLNKHGLSETVLTECWLGFASDGASVMLGKKAAVYTKLTERFPNIISWHCYNHRLELAVNDAVKSCCQVIHFKSFMDRLYSLYSMSPNNRRLLDQCASQLGIQVRKIGKILDVRWVASSFRAVKAVWDSYAALHHSFTTATDDMRKTSKVRAEFAGLARQLESGTFLQNLALMYDALQELSDLSEALQSSNLSSAVSGSSINFATHRCLQRSQGEHVSVAVNDLPSVCRTQCPNTKIFLYADDAKVYKIVTCDEDRKDLQRVIGLDKVKGKAKGAYSSS